MVVTPSTCSNPTTATTRLSTITYGSGTNKADIDIGANSSVTINSAGAIEVDLDAFNDPDGAAATGALTANITVGDGNDDIRVNSDGDFAADQGSKITIAAGAGNNTVNTNSNDGAVVSITALGGDDTINASTDDNSTVTINAGEGNNNVTGAVGDNGELSVTTGGGTDTIFANGGTASGAEDHCQLGWRQR